MVLRRYRGSDSDRQNKNLKSAKTAIQSSRVSSLLSRSNTFWQRSRCLYSEQVRQRRQVAQMARERGSYLKRRLAERTGLVLLMDFVLSTPSQPSMQTSSQRQLKRMVVICFQMCGWSFLGTSISLLGILSWDLNFSQSKDSLAPWNSFISLIIALSTSLHSTIRSISSKFDSLSYRQLFSSNSSYVIFSQNQNLSLMATSLGSKANNSAAYSSRFLKTLWQLPQKPQLYLLLVKGFYSVQTTF